MNVKDLRSDEKEIAVLFPEETGKHYIYLAVYDLRDTVKLQAWLGIITTFMVCVVLASGAMLFSKLTTDLVISPIEDMIVKVNNITADPLKAAHDEEERLLYEEIAEKELEEKALTKASGQIEAGQEEKKEGPMETAMLQ